MSPLDEAPEDVTRHMLTVATMMGITLTKHWPHMPGATEQSLEATKLIEGAPEHTRAGSLVAAAHSAVLGEMSKRGITPAPELEKEMDEFWSSQYKAESSSKGSGSSHQTGAKKEKKRTLLSSQEVKEFLEEEASRSPEQDPQPVKRRRTRKLRPDPLEQKIEEVSRLENSPAPSLTLHDSEFEEVYGRPRLRPRDEKKVETEIQEEVAKDTPPTAGGDEEPHEFDEDNVPSFEENEFWRSKKRKIKARPFSRPGRGFVDTIKADFSLSNALFRMLEVLKPPPSFIFSYKY